MSVANRAGLFLAADRNRKCVFSVTIGEADGDDVVVANDDNVRVKVGTLGDSPLLEVQSKAATDNGSQCTATNPTTVTIAAGDLSFPPGIYDAEVLVVDKSESNPPKHAENGIFHLRNTIAGDLSGT